MTLSDARESLQRYQYRGIATGGFLRAVLANDLLGALDRSDPESQIILHDIAVYIDANVGREIRGSYEKIDIFLLKKNNDSLDMFENDEPLLSAPFAMGGDKDIEPEL